MHAREYLLFALKLLRDNSSIAEIDSIDQSLKFILENPNNTDIWIWLSFFYSDYISNKNGFSHSKWLSCIPMNNCSLDMSLWPINRPLVVYKGEIFDLNRNDLFTHVISEDNTQALLDAYNWSDMLKAEILLAAHGDKVSRTTLPVKTVLEISKNTNLALLIGYDIFIPVEDSIIDGYSNTSESISVLLADSSLEQEGEVYVYFSKYYQDALLASVLDNHNLAGRLLGIPDCCIEFFKNNWSYVVDNFEGDMAFLNFEHYFTDKIYEINIPWQINAHSMYTGGGLTWHFPCTHNCSSTILEINKRVDLLDQLDTKLASRLVENQRKSFYLSRDRHIFESDENTRSDSSRVVRFL
jgi:hypothetical protein